MDNGGDPECIDPDESIGTMQDQCDGECMVSSQGHHTSHTSYTPTLIFFVLNGTSTKIT